MAEVWKDIPGYEELYQVSNYGRIKTLPREVFYGVGKKRMTEEKFVQPVTIRRQGYGAKFLAAPLLRRGHVAHRSIKLLVARLFLGAKQNASVRHKDGNYMNCNADNLEVCPYWKPPKIQERVERTAKASKGQYVGTNEYTGNVVRFDSLAEANDFCGVEPQSQDIVSCCKGSMRAAHGYRWQYC